MATKLSASHSKWDELKTNLITAERLISQGTLDQNEVAVLKGNIREGVNWIRRIDFTDSSTNSPNRLLAQSLHDAMLATASKAEATLSQLGETTSSSKMAPITVVLAGLGAVGYRLLSNRASKALVLYKAPAYVPPTSGLPSAMELVTTSVKGYWEKFLGIGGALALTGGALALTLAVIDHYQSNSNHLLNHFPDQDQKGK